MSMHDASAVLPAVWLALQYAIVALVVLASAWTVLAGQFPQAARRLRVGAALWLLRDSRAAWMRAWGTRIAPRTTVGADGCGGCDGCGTGADRTGAG